MADEKKPEDVDVYRTSKSTLMNFVFFGVLILFLFILVRYAIKKGGDGAAVAGAAT